MNTHEITQKINTLKKLTTEWNVLTTILKSMDKESENGLEIPTDYYQNVQKRIKTIENKFVDLVIDEILK